MSSEIRHEVEELQDQVRKLEIQVAALSNVKPGRATEFGAVGEPPHPSTAKCQMCKRCSHVRMPHKSNPHYACGARHENVEPTWTCDLYSFSS